jgi:hypothetical protein
MHPTPETRTGKDVLRNLVDIAADPAYPGAVRGYARMILEECRARAEKVLADIEGHLQREGARVA